MIDIGWLLLFNTWFFSLLITTISAVQAVVKCVCGWVRQMFTHKTKACVSPAVVSMAVDSGGGDSFFWEMISENEMEKMLGGHFDGIGGYPDDDREKLYVPVGERRIILDNKTPPVAAFGLLNVTVSGDYFFFICLFMLIARALYWEHKN